MTDELWEKEARWRATRAWWTRDFKKAGQWTSRKAFQEGYVQGYVAAMKDVVKSYREQMQAHPMSYS